MHRAQGKLDEAKPYMEKALAIDIKVHGEEHPDVAVSYNNIATLYQAQVRVVERVLLRICRVGLKVGMKSQQYLG